MNPAVCIPFRGIDVQRVTNLVRARQQYDELAWPIFFGDHKGESFCRSQAINNAAAQCPDADVLFIADCDFVLEHRSQIIEAAEIALRDDCYVVAYSVMWALGQQGTNMLRAGRTPSRRAVVEQVALIWGNAFAISRTLFDRVCGFDERFLGWGAEDIAFLVSASTMGGAKQRIKGGAWHMTHPTNEDRDHLPENNALASRYRGADGDRDAMRLILAERGCE